MKRYDREQRKWVGVDEKPTSKHKDPKICIGKKPHDYVLVLPYNCTYDDNYKYNPELAYQILDEEIIFHEEQRKRLLDMGVRLRYGRFARKQTRELRCSRCKKVKYEYQE